MDTGYKRINRLCDTFLEGLPKSVFQRSVVEGKNWALAISKRGTAESPNKDGRKYEVVGGITVRELIQIEQNFADDAEALDRIRRIIIENDRSAARSVAAAGMSHQDLNDEIERRVAVEVRRYLESIAPKAGTPAAAEEKKAEPAQSSAPAAVDEDLSVAYWTRQAEAVGYKKPVIGRPSDPTQVDGRWLRRFKQFTGEVAAQ